VSSTAVRTPVTPVTPALAPRRAEVTRTGADGAQAVTARYRGPRVPTPGDRPGRGGAPVIVLRRVIGDELRRRRQDQGRTLREVSSAARVSLGYLSEVERGQKEASSELLASICTALDVPLAIVLRCVSDEVAVLEGVAPVTELPVVPDTVVAAA
jgi:hypothetical protein